MNNDQSLRLLSTADLAEELGVPPTTLRQWRYLGKGPAFVKVGRHVRYRPADVDTWLAAHAVDPEEAA